MRTKYVSNKTKDKRKFLLLVILGITIGLAAVATTLKINGFTLIKKNTWSIKWDRDSVAFSEDMPSGLTLPTVSTSANGMTDDTVSFDATLSVPGDFYEFYIDAVNDGTINGKVASVTTTWKKNGTVITELPDFLEYKVVYAENREVPQEGDILYKDSTKTYFIQLMFKEEATTLPNSTDVYTATVSIAYNQAPEGSTVPAVSPRGPGGEAIANNSEDAPTPIDISDPPSTVTPVVNPVRIMQPSVTNGDQVNPASEDIIYMGADPSNYIYFNCESLDEQDDYNCEIWRIIKVDSDAGNRIKIIREDSIGAYAWNDWDDENRKLNDWSTSTLKEYLNDDYYNNELTEVAQKLIPTVKWYNFGGYNVVRLNEGKAFGDDHISAMTAASAYVNERTRFKTTDSAIKKQNVLAKVGLMYASDYGYASSACYSMCTATGNHPCAFYDYNCGEYENDYYDVTYGYVSDICRDSNWLFEPTYEWTMTASLLTLENAQWDADRDDPYYAWEEDASESLYCQSPTRERNFARIYYHPDELETYDQVFATDGVIYKGKIDGGALESNNAYDYYDVRPVVYLKSGVSLEGTGTREDPYKIIASEAVLNGDDVLPEDQIETEPDDGGSSGGSGSGITPSATHTNTSCSEQVAPTCELTNLTVLSNGFDFAFNCSDDVQINRITSLFDADPYHGQYDSSTFDKIGTIKNGTVINNGKTKTYSGRWTTLAKHKPSKGVCYYFSFGGEDTCGNWVVYHTDNCVQF